ncbi:MAG: hypothetical protein L0Y42_02195 [Phycisphaerales bacterium]|nr:hypothetical protein [Phycisphaerales bacterium]
MQLRFTRVVPGVLSVALIGFLTLPAAGIVTWDEAINGDLSGDRFNPTQLTLTLGVNSIIATSVGTDREYYTFTLPDGWFLSQIIVASYVGNDPLAFLGVQEGTIFSEPPVNPIVGNILGYSHFGTENNTVGTDILDNVGAGPGAIGFTPPLGPGAYTWWSQQTGANPVTYQLDFVVVIPGPAGLALLALAGTRPRRRRK